MECLGGGGLRPPGFHLHFWLRQLVSSSLLPALPELLEEIYMVFDRDPRDVEGVGGPSHRQNQIFVVDLETLVEEDFLARHHSIFQVHTGCTC